MPSPVAAVAGEGASVVAAGEGMALIPYILKLTKGNHYPYLSRCN